MKTIIAFAGSNSSTSINKRLATYAASLVNDVSITILDLNDFEMPIYSSDREKNNGYPDAALSFVEHIRNSDGIIISLAEYNGAYTGAFKNIFDWTSRVEQKTFMNKPMLLMATSPGARGGASVLEMAMSRFPRHDANIIETFSLPSFNDNFKNGEISNLDLNDELKQKVDSFQKSL